MQSRIIYNHIVRRHKNRTDKYNRSKEQLEENVLVSSTFLVVTNVLVTLSDVVLFINVLMTNNKFCNKSEKLREF